MKHGLDEWTPCRFDVIAVDDDEVTVLKNALRAVNNYWLGSYGQVLHNCIFLYLIVTK